MSGYRDTLRDEFRDRDYRYAYAEDFLTTFVATQIRTLREQRGMTQQELGIEIGTKQAGVSRYENANYSAWKTETLRKIARALGVRLKISFEPFGPLLDEAAEFSQEALKRPKFEDDPAFKAQEERPEQDKGTAFVDAIVSLASSHWNQNLVLKVSPAVGHYMNASSTVLASMFPQSPFPQMCGYPLSPASELAHNAGQYQSKASFSPLAVNSTQEQTEDQKGLYGRRTN